MREITIKIVSLVASCLRNIVSVCAICGLRIYIVFKKRSEIVQSNDRKLDDDDDDEG